MTKVRTLNTPKGPAVRPTIHIGVVTCFHERHELTPLWMMRFRNLQAAFAERAPKGVNVKLSAFVIVSDGDKVNGKECDEQARIGGLWWDYAPNAPLGRKWNKAVELAIKTDMVERIGLTHVMVVGQDDLIGRDYLSRLFAPLLSGARHLAARSAAFIEPATRRACGWMRPEPAAYVGAGRVLSTRLVMSAGMMVSVETAHPFRTPFGTLKPGEHTLPAMLADYIDKAGRGKLDPETPGHLRLWDPDRMSALDASVETFLTSLGQGPAALDNFPHEVVDVKTAANIWSFDHLSSFSSNMREPVAKPLDWDAVVNTRHFWPNEVAYLNDVLCNKTPEDHV